MAENIKFEVGGKTYNTADRTVKGQSAREYWAGITGQSKEDYPGATSSVKNKSDIDNYINSGQSYDIKSGTKANEPAIRSSISSYNDIVSGITGVKPSSIKAPVSPGFEKSYLDLRGQYGVSNLETKMTDLNTQAETLAAEFRQTKAAEGAKFVPTNVAEGRVSEQERSANERLDVINRSLNTINNQLNTAYKTIDTIINYKGMDYDAAVKAYDSQFSQYMQTFNLVKGVDESIKSEKEQVKDSARANLQIMYNSISSNSEGWKSLSGNQQTQISKLEAQSGLPQGFYKTIESKNPGGEIITTKSWTDASNKEYVSVVTRQQDGSLKTNNMYVGQGKSSGATSEIDKEDKELSSFRNDAASLQMSMSSRDPNQKKTWSQAFQNLKTKYPQASTELINQTLGLDNRAKYDN